MLPVPAIKVTLLFVGLLLSRASVTGPLPETLKALLLVTVAVSAEPASWMLSFRTTLVATPGWRFLVMVSPVTVPVTVPTLPPVAKRTTLPTAMVVGVLAGRLLVAVTAVGETWASLPPA